MQEEEIHKECLHKLCEAIEAKVERKMQTTRDYDLLAECIFQELHQQISPTTLKRIWGYLPGNVTPRVSTLDILAHFVGYKNWEQFFPLILWTLFVRIIKERYIEAILRIHLT